MDQSREFVCHFPTPPPRRAYCQPAPFSREHGGAAYHRMAVAYGASRPHF